MSTPSKRRSALRYTGSANLRTRLVLSTLSSRPVHISEIRSTSATAPGLSPSEISFIRLLDKLTNGTSIEISPTGTTLRYRPGVLAGSASARAAHDCHPSRALAYYLEPLLMLAPFCKRPLHITLRGPTHGAHDVCVDALAAVAVPLLRRLTLGTPVHPEVVVLRRAAASGPAVYAAGKGGAVVFRCGVVAAKIAPVELVERGVVRRVRGVAFANRVSPAFVAGLVDAVRGGLNAFTPDVYVHTDHGNAADGGAGFGVQLMAETTEGCLVGADWSAVGKGDGVGDAKKVGTAAVNMLLEQVAQGGCVDAACGCLALLMCALADCDVSRVRFGRLTDQMVWFLRDLKQFFGVVFKVAVKEIESDVESESESESEREEESEVEESGGESEEGGEGKEGGDHRKATKGKRKREPISRGIILSCVGIGHVNTARQRF